MPIEILTLKAMQQAMKRVDRCYICGELLSAESGNGPVSVDHIVPRAHRGPEPSAPQERWSPMLPVHRACEDHHKAARDQIAKIIKVFGARGPGAWSKSELDVFKKFAHVRLEHDEESGMAPVLEVGEELFEAALLWVRGLHTLLYGDVLPNPLGHVTRSPAPLFPSGDERTGGSRRFELELKAFILQTVAKAVARDRVRAWGSEIHYQCVWTQIQDDEPEHWRCLWTLELHRTHEWAMSARGADAPWYGAYFVRALPDGATVL